MCHIELLSTLTLVRMPKIVFTTDAKVENKQQCITLSRDETTQNKVIGTQEGVQWPLAINDVGISTFLIPGAIRE